MSQHDRVAIFPSRANLVLMKQRILGATRGLNLLKRKRDALDLKLRELGNELRKSKEVIDTVMREAIFAMTKAHFLDTDLKPAAVMGPERADVFMRIRNHKVAGLLLPTFDLYPHASHCFPLTGLSRGGEQVEVIRRKFQEAIKTLITLASLEFAVKVLEDGVRQNNMRINGLDYVLIPRFTNTVNYIRDELDEYEREDFYRLKRSQAKQRKAKEKFAKMVWQHTHGDSDPKRPKEIGYGTHEEFNIDNFSRAQPAIAEIDRPGANAEAASEPQPPATGEVETQTDEAEELQEQQQPDQPEQPDQPQP